MEERNQALPVSSTSRLRRYRDRPWACRMYPLGLAEPKSRHAGRPPVPFPGQEDLCQGHGQGVSHLGARVD